jgi:23S rRNA (cytosine1962-C5)-methyltransferase
VLAAKAWRAALHLRTQWRTQGLLRSDLVRVIDQSADGMPGVVLDDYAGHARLEINAGHGPWSVAMLADLAADLARQQPGRLSSLTVVDRSAAGVSRLWVAAGQPPMAHVVDEDGLKMLVRVADPRAVGSGAFVDQRLARALVRQHARGARVLNLFAHAGGFSAAAASGGAARVDTVDAARKCAPWAATNFALNGIDPRGHRFVVEDALLFIERIRKRAERYDIIICDPPTQATAARGHFVLARAWPQLMAELWSICDHLLVFSCNDRDIQPAALVAGARQLWPAAAPLAMPVDVRSVDHGPERPMRGVALLRG